MSITAQPLTQAREALTMAAEQKLALMGQVAQQSRKIVELEREVQRLAPALSRAEQALADAQVEIEALRAQLPDGATVNAFNNLVEFLSAPSELHPTLRIAA